MEPEHLIRMMAPKQKSRVTVIDDVAYEQARRQKGELVNV